MKGGLFATLAGLLTRRETMGYAGATTKTYYADVVWHEIEGDTL